MKKFFVVLFVALFAIRAFAQVQPADQFTGTSSPFTAITTRTHAKPIYAPFSIATTSTINTHSTTASSTFSNGINLLNGCFSIAGTCLGGGGGAGTVGTGTQGQFPFYNAAGTTLTATSTLFVSQAGNIGIGTASPATLLDINGITTHRGNVLTSANNTNDIGATGTRFNNVYGQFLWATGIRADAINSADNSVSMFLHSGTTNYFYDGSGVQQIFLPGVTGYVGIGTSSPYAKLSVVGPVVAEYFHATSTSATSTFAGDVTLGLGKIVTTHAVRGDASDGVLIQANNYTNVGLFGAGNTSNSLFYGGVNIDGTTRLATSLTGILKATSGTVSVATPGTDYGTVSSIATNNGLTGGTITSSGTIGLATINAGVLGAVTNGSVPTSLATSSLGIAISDTTGTLGISRGGTNASSFTTSGNAVYYDGTSLATAPLTSKITIPYASTTAFTASGLATVGTLGIGTTNPVSPLDVRGAIGTFATIGSPTVRLGINGTTPSIILDTNTSIFSLDYLEGTGIRWVYNGASVPMVLTSGGNLGLGTTTPWGKLSVTNTGTGPSFVVEDTTSPDSTPFIVDASGNVGIGTASPAEKLHIKGADPAIRLDNTGANSWLIQQLDSNSALRFRGNGTDRMTILNTGNVGIGTTSPATTLSVAGSAYITTGIGAGVVETTAGRITSNTGFNVTNTASTSIIMRNGSTVLSSRSYGDATGLVSLQAPSDGTYVSVNIGSTNNGVSSATTSLQNIAIGHRLLYSNTYGSQNIVMGGGGLFNNTTGSKNIALGGIGNGGAPMVSNTTGTGNIAIGNNTNGSQYTLMANTTGSANVAIGDVAGSAATTGSQNTYIGNSAGGGTVITGNGNTFLGAVSNTSNGAINYSTAIGYAANVGCTNCIVLGAATGNGAANVGIGTTSPWAKLSVTNTGTQPSFLVEDSTSPDTSPFVIGASGNVGVGTTSPSSIFQLFSTATTTMSVDSNHASRGSCLELKDSDGVGYTYVTANNGVLTASTVSCK